MKEDRQDQGVTYLIDFLINTAMKDFEYSQLRVRTSSYKLRIQVEVDRDCGDYAMPVVMVEKDFVGDQENLSYKY